MPEEPLNIARFDHVNASGDLVFEAMNRHFRVRVTDALERGILEAKQVRAEREGMPLPQAASALPISQIQSMIRAGITPDKVAQQFGISEALVRRFAAPVETEKKYAIDQFLSMPTSKNVRSPRPNAEVIAESLLTARIGMDELSWRATRRHHEPWRIEATFETSGRLIRADWSWNMRDNTVVALNATAKRLLGQSAAPITGFAAPDVVPGPGAGTAGAPAVRLPAAFDPASAPTRGTTVPDLRTVPAPDGAAGPSDSLPTGDADAARPADDLSSAESPSASPSGGSADPASVPDTSGDADGARAAAEERRSNPLTAWLYGGSGAHGAHGAASSPAGEDGSAADRRDSAASPEDDAARGETNAAGAPKRKSGRSAVPSWDEILFGE